MLRRNASSAGWLRNGPLNIISAIASRRDVLLQWAAATRNFPSSCSSRVMWHPRHVPLFDGVRIGSRLGIELPFGSRTDARRGLKRRLYGENWSTGDTYNAAFGQGYVNVTPLQLISSVGAIVNGGTLYRPTLIRDTLDVNGNVVESFEPDIDRTINLDTVAPTEPIKLMMLEDMIMKGEDSLACVCESSSDFYNPLRCNPDSYVNTVNVNPEENLYTPRNYTIEVPAATLYGQHHRNPVRFDSPYPRRLSERQPRDRGGGDGLIK